MHLYNLRYSIPMLVALILITSCGLAGCAPQPGSTTTGTESDTVEPPTPTVESPTSTPTAEPEAVVIAQALNVREGPGTQYDILDAVILEDQLHIVGQAPGCTWLNVITPNQVIGWVSAEFVDLRLDCNDIPLVPTPEPPPPTSTLMPTEVPPTSIPASTLVATLEPAPDQEETPEPTPVPPTLEQPATPTSTLPPTGETPLPPTLLPPATPIPSPTASPSPVPTEAVPPTALETAAAPTELAATAELPPPEIEPSPVPNDTPPP